MTAMCSPGGPTARPRLRDKAVQEDSTSKSTMLPPLTFHGLRHCFASLALAGGADIAVVSKLLGHASISITSDVYGHLVGTVASLAPPLGMDAAQPFHRCRSSSTVCWESTPRIAFLSPEPGSR